MKRAAFLFGCLFLLACASDHSTSPSRATVLCEGEIGPEGGSVGNEDIRITVPPQAFPDVRTVEILVHGDDQGDTENTASPHYIIDGLPAEWGRPLTAVLKVNRELTDETFAAVGPEETVPELDATLPVFSLVACRDSSGAVIFDIPSPEADTTAALKKRADDGLRVHVEALTGYMTKQGRIGGPLFTLTFPASHCEYIWSAVEQIESKFRSNGFTRSSACITREYVSIQACRFYFEQGMIPVFLDPRFLVHVNRDNLDAPETITHLARVLFQTYSPFYTQNHWLFIAFSCWAESLVSNQSPFVPLLFSPNEGASFRPEGIDQTHPSKIMRAVHGRGMSALIHFLAESSPGKTDWIVDFYKRESGHAFGDLVNRLPEPVIHWWPEYIRRYIGGQIFQVRADRILQHAAQTWQVSPRSDGSIDHAFTARTAGDISCHLYRINRCDASKLEDNQALSLKVVTENLYKERLDLMVFQYDGTGLTLLKGISGGDLTLTISNVKSLFGQGSDLLVAVVNSNCTLPTLAGSGEFTLEVTDSQAPWYKEVCMVDCRLAMNTHSEDKNGSDSEDARTLLSFSGTNQLSGSCEVREDEENEDIQVYSGQWDYNPPEQNVCRQRGDMLIKYHLDEKRIVYFKCNSTSLCSDGYTIYCSVEGAGLPTLQNNPSSPGSSIIYGLSGGQAHACVTSAYYIGDNPYSTLQSVSGPFPDPDSYVKIYFMDRRD
ncbi:hypothetical protein JW777_00870 [bacterium]|nr:hypothetical protein [bacterium]